MTDETKAEAAPLSVEEMTEMLSLCPVTEEEHSRAIATAAELERLTKWILANDRYGGRGLLRHVSQLKEQNPVAMVRLKDGSQVVAHAPAGLEVRAFGAEDLDESGMPRWLK